MKDIAESRLARLKNQEKETGLSYRSIFIGKYYSLKIRCHPKVYGSYKSDESFFDIYNLSSMFDFDKCKLQEI